MKRYMGIAALTASLLMSTALPALADTITGAGTSANPAKLSDYGRSGSLAFPVTGLANVSGSFTYAYYFQVDSRAKLTGITASASSTSGNDDVPNVSFSSFEIVGLFAQPLLGGPVQAYYPGIKQQNFFFSANQTYELIVRGSVVDQPGFSELGKFNGNLSVVSAVPLPSSVAMFGTAVLGLGAFGAMRRKKSMSAAAAV